MMRFFLATGFSLLLLLAAPTAWGEEKIDFARQILPILSNKCFVCHGPDTNEEHTDLRLDSLEAATADRGGYQAINPETPDESEILARIQSTDDPMPPADAEKQLTAEERELISRWIRQGGQYAKHWAFVPPTKSSQHDAIDGFIRAKLKTTGIDLAPQADPATLARRVALVLTGLPPEPEQLDEFLADPTHDAYERLVEKMLASPRFGEHQARYWLDAVRYGDTHGLHLDNRRGIYPYRDWVVNAFNDNLPLDSFITWQLAGDLLADPSLEQQVATGFVRLNPSTGEGGAIAEEFQAKNNFDRIETVGTVFLGMTLTCARCHTHKYDPIPQREYYRLLAFFNSTAEPALDGNSYTYGPTVDVPANQADWKKWRQLEKAREEILKEADSLLRSTEAVDYAKSTVPWKTENWRITRPVAADKPMPKAADKKWSKATGLPGAISGRAARGKLPADNQVVWLTADVEVPREQSIWLTFSGAPGTAVLIDDAADPAITKESDDRTEITTLKLSPGKHALTLKVVGGKGLSAIEVRVENAWDSLANTKDWSEVSKQDRLRMLADSAAPIANGRLAEFVERTADEIRRLRANFTTSLVARGLPKPRETRLLKRGEYDKPEGEPLEPGILSVMSAFPEAAPRNRLGLAQWLTSPDHPLVSRVLINRLWQRVFGESLVRSPEDFGLQGQQPTHPGLLDWLAVELQESGWNLKHMLRLMVTSETFRQSSAQRSDVSDPENLLLARGPSYRLDAEVLRDLGPWSSGLLDSQMGGEGVKPYQPGGMWLALAHPRQQHETVRAGQGTKIVSPQSVRVLETDEPASDDVAVRRTRSRIKLRASFANQYGIAIAGTPE